MAYEFLGGDLETAKGRTDFIDSFVGIKTIDAELDIEALSDFYNTLEDLAKQFPEYAAELLRQTLQFSGTDHQDQLFDLAESLAVNLINHSRSDLAADALTFAGVPETLNTSERELRIRVYENLISGDVVDIEDITLGGLARISKDYLRLRSISPVPIEPAHT